MRLCRWLQKVYEAYICSRSRVYARLRFIVLLSRLTLYNHFLQTAIIPWCSMMFSDAEALLFQSAKRALIDVRSIHVATNEMEEILQLLTERDIERTNNTPPPHSYAHPYSLFPRHTLQSNSVNISPTVSASLSAYSIRNALHKAVLHQDKSFQILYCWEPFHLFPDSCWTTKAFLSYLKNKTLSLSPPAVSPFTACFHKCQNLPHVPACFTCRTTKTVYVQLKVFPFCDDVISVG